jgi:HTH-type transcriptional regulator/antitoxin HipB
LAEFAHDREHLSESSDMLTIVSMERVNRIFTTLELGAAIKRARRARNLTQVQLAEHANVSRGALQKIEEGRGTVTLPTILRLLRTLSLDLAVVSRADARPIEKLPNAP